MEIVKRQKILQPYDNFFTVVKSGMSMILRVSVSPAFKIIIQDEKVGKEHTLERAGG